MGRPTKLPLLLEALQSRTARRRGLTQIQLQTYSGLSDGCVFNHIHKLHAERRVYICGWTTENAEGKGVKYQARYRLGDKPDAPKPQPLTRAEVSRRFRERAIKSGKIEDIRAYGRSYWWRKQPARRDPLAAALFGMGAQA